METLNKQTKHSAGVPDITYRASTLRMMRRSVAAFVFLAIAAMLFPQVAAGATYQWDGSSSSQWNTRDNWTVGGATPAALPGSGDDVVFYASGAGNLSTGLWQNFSIASLTFGSGATDSVTIAAGSGSRRLTIGSGGITVESGSGAHTISTTYVTVGASQGWTNDSSNLFTVSSATSLGVNTITVGGSGNTTISGVVSGTGSIVKSGSGALLLSGSNTYTGGTTISEGTLQIGASNRLANSGAVVIESAGTFDHQTFTDQIGALRLNGGAITGTAGTITASSLTSTGGNIHAGGTGIFSLGGNVTYNAASGAETTLTVGGTLNLYGARTFSIADGVQADDVVISAVVANGSGTRSLTKTGAGVLVMGGANTYTGGTTISDGVLRISANERLYNSGAMTVAAAGTFDHQSYNEQIGALTLNGGVITGSGTMTISTLTSTGGNIHADGSGVMTLGGNVAYNAAAGAETTLTVGGTLNLNGSRTFTIADGVQANDVVINAVIANGSGTRSLTKAGAGTLVLTADNTYTGTTTISAGTLRTTADERLYNSGAMSVSAAGTFDHQSYNERVAALTLNRGAITGSGTMTITTLTSTGGNLHADGLGMLSMGGNLAYNAASGAETTLTIGGQINLNGSRTFTVNNGLQNDDVVISAVIANGSAASGITKRGLGTLVLSGANTYTGSTTIYTNSGTVRAENNRALGTGRTYIYSGGTLVIASGVTISNNLTLYGGGTLAVNGTYSGGAITISGNGSITGRGTINSAVRAASGTVISPGASPGTLTFGSGLNLSSGGEYYWELANLITSGAGVNYDFINVTGGSFVLGGTSVLSLHFIDSATDPDSGDAFWKTNRTWKIIDQNGTNITNFATLLNGDYTAGQFSTVLGTSSNAGDVYLVWTHAPEPATVALLVIGGAAMILRRRKSTVSAIR